MAPILSAQQAAEILRGGGVVVIPTETVYGLAADAENELAVRRIYAVKGRPLSHPLIVHVLDTAAAESWAREFPESARTLAKRFWPGPLTLVLPRAPRAMDAVTAGQETVALRVPAHPAAQEILRAFGGGLAAPSANRFSKISPTTAEHAQSDLGLEIDGIVDGGACQVGVESTIVDVTRGGPVILRPGGVTPEQLEEALGAKVPWHKEAATRVPGQHPAHYAPRAGVVLAAEGEVAARAEELARGGAKVAALSPKPRPSQRGVDFFAVPADPARFARDLYSSLRKIDEKGYELIVVSLPEQRGLGLAIADRLTRAAMRGRSPPSKPGERAVDVTHSEG